MNKDKWIRLVISAGTDFTITFASALIAVIGSNANGQLPGKVGWLSAVLGGVLAFSRTISQGMKAADDVKTALATPAP